MQLEKHNDNSLFCYVTEQDLESRQLKETDLFYGSYGFRRLLAEILQDAAQELAFEKKDLPLMVEAVPMQHGEYFLQIFMVEEAEELDPRFAQFSPSIFEDLEDIAASAEDEDEPEEDADSSIPEPARYEPEHYLPAFKQLMSEPKGSILIFNSFEDLLHALRAADKEIALTPIKSTLYYDPDRKDYLLVLPKSASPQSHLSMPGVFYEYARSIPYNAPNLARLREHCKCLIRSGALASLLRHTNAK